MAKHEAPADVLMGFVKAVHDSILEPLRKNQVKISWQRELRESKRFIEAENKIAEFGDAHARIKDDFLLCDKVVEVLRSIHANRMSQFLENGKALSTSDCDKLKLVLEAYLGLLAHVDGIRRLQTTMLAQGKLKKMPLAYDEINATLTEVTALAGRMPGILMDGVSELSDTLEKAA